MACGSGGHSSASPQHCWESLHSWRQLEGARGVLLPQTSHYEPWLSVSFLRPSSSSSGGNADSVSCFISLDPDQFVAVNGETSKDLNQLFQGPTG